MSQDQIPAPAQVLMQLLLGKFVSRAITCAADLGVADLIGDGRHTAASLAERAGAHPGALYRVLRALAAVGVFTELPGRQFENNPVSQLLRDDAPGSQRAMAQWLNTPCSWAAWGRLEFSVHTGKPAFDEVWGMQVFDYLGTDPAAREVFQTGLSRFSAIAGNAVADTYDFSGVGRVVDVGGGLGATLAAICAKHAHLSGVLFDLPEVIEAAREHLRGQGVAERIETVAGSFFDAVPAGADAYTMKFILHDWDDDRCVDILRNCRAAMADGGRVLVIEQVLGGAHSGPFGALMDLEMLVLTTGGRERDADEFAALLSRAGLSLVGITPTDAMVSVIEARAA